VKYLLDTDHISIVQRAAGADYVILKSRMDLHPKTDFGLPIVSLHEQFVGCHAFLNRARRPAELLRGYAMLEQIRTGFAGDQIVPFDTAAIAEFDQLTRLRLRTATMDLRIAATALSRHLTLLTRNRSHFAGVPGLVVEDWTV
jgi:tRNA(fMet)-specific endonuclease VapC